MEAKIYSEDIASVEQELSSTRSRVSNTILEVKSDLLSVYLMNLVLYSKLAEEERRDSPITEMLVKTTILLEKICQMEKKADIVIKTATQEPREEKRSDGKRAITEEMMRNKFVARKRKIEDRNPRLKHKNKAKKLAEQAQVRDDGNIDTKRPKTSRFK